MGRQGGQQFLSLDQGCVDTGTVQHELMHVAGFFHEQSRTDRDDFVNIHWDNIDPRFQKHNFRKYDSTAVDLLRTPYDISIFQSIIHFPHK